MRLIYKIGKQGQEVNHKLEKLNSKVESVRDEVNQNIGKVGEEVDNKLDKLDSKVESVRDEVNQTIGKLNDNLDNLSEDVSTLSGDVKAVEIAMNGLDKRIDNQEFSSRAITVALASAFFVSVLKIFFPNLPPGNV